MNDFQLKRDYSVKFISSEYVRTEYIREYSSMRLLVFIFISHTIFLTKRKYAQLVHIFPNVVRTSHVRTYTVVEIYQWL